MKRVPANPKGHVALEHDGPLVRIAEVRLPVREDVLAVRVVGRNRLRRVGERIDVWIDHHEGVVHTLVVDDRAGALEVVVAEDVVDVMLGVDQVADRTMRLGQLAHRQRPCR